MRGGAAAAECSGCVQLRADRDSVWRRESAARLGWNRKQDARVCGSSVGHGRGLSDKMEQPSLDGRLPSLSGRWRESAGPKQNSLGGTVQKKRERSLLHSCLGVAISRHFYIFRVTKSGAETRERCRALADEMPLSPPLEFGVWLWDVARRSVARIKPPVAATRSTFAYARPTHNPSTGHSFQRQATLDCAHPGPRAEP